ncbi:MAG: hypothetical protein LBI18_06295 [Planctomycetaceae bacterium]|jgi:Mrp family chromosome partitioning ATPase|nr:hypothetical protein [Planctomycetaceae bacterium]
MSVIPEPIRRKDERQSDSITSDKTQTPEESVLLPSILRGAAYISSGGRVYRLFSDNDEISFPMATFEKTLQFDPLPEIPPIDDFASVLEDSSAEYFEETLISLLPNSSVDSETNPASATPSILQLQQQQHSTPIKFSSKETRSVKTGNYKIFSATEHNEPLNTNARTPLYQINQEKTTLKLFEAFPEWTVSSNLLPKNTSPALSSVTTQPIIRMIRLEIPFRPIKSKHCFRPLSLRHGKSVRQSLLKGSLFKNSAPKDSIPRDFVPKDSSPKNSLSNDSSPNDSLSNQQQGTTKPIEAELPLTNEPLLSKPTLAESTLAESQPNTLLFPSCESLTAEPRSSAENRRTWRLIWQSHWPEHLKSLELAASDQICFLADHLEIHKEQKRRVFSFNSFHPGDGCTTLALCAARELAERGYRILLVDAHRQNPELPQLLHLPTNPEFYEIITLIPDRLELLPWSETSIEVNSNDQTTPSLTQSFAEVVGSFRDAYDFVLLDNGSLVESPLNEHVALWREMCSDGVLLVVNMKRLPSVNIRSIAQRLLQNRISLLGIVENYV